MRHAQSIVEVKLLCVQLFLTFCVTDRQTDTQTDARTDAARSNTQSIAVAR